MFPNNNEELRGSERLKLKMIFKKVQGKVQNSPHIPHFRLYPVRYVVYCFRGGSFQPLTHLSALKQWPVDGGQLPVAKIQLSVVGENS